MRSFWNIVRHKYFALSATIMIVVLPLVLIISQQQQELRGRAQASTSLSFSPPTTSASPLLKKVGDNFYLDLMLSPGNNLVSLIKVDITYDPTKLRLSSIDPVSVNPAVFPQIVEGPVYSAGRVQAVLSVGSDFSKAIAVQSRAMTLNFTTLSASNQTLVSFGANTAVFSVAAADTSGASVLSTTSPAFIKITKKTGPSNGNGHGK